MVFSIFNSPLFNLFHNSVALAISERKHHEDILGKYKAKVTIYAAGLSIDFNFYERLTIRLN